MLKIECWVLEYQDSRGYRRKRRFGSFQQAKNYAIKEGVVILIIQAERSVEPDADIP